MIVEDLDVLLLGGIEILVAKSLNDPSVSVSFHELMFYMERNDRCSSINFQDWLQLRYVEINVHSLDLPS